MGRNQLAAPRACRVAAGEQRALGHPHEAVADEFSPDVEEDEVPGLKRHDRRGGHRNLVARP